jgi:hypothetical protein
VLAECSEEVCPEINDLPSLGTLSLSSRKYRGYAQDLASPGLANLSQNGCLHGLVLEGLRAKDCSKKPTEF